MQQVLFHFSRSRAVLRILISLKNLGQYKKFPWDKFFEEKRTFCKAFRSMRNFILELLYLADDLADLELSIFINFLYLKIYII